MSCQFSIATRAGSGSEIQQCFTPDCLNRERRQGDTKMPIVIPEELLARTAEMVCYFLTAVGSVLGFLFLPRG